MVLRGVGLCRSSVGSFFVLVGMLWWGCCGGVVYLIRVVSMGVFYNGEATEVEWLFGLVRVSKKGLDHGIL